MTPLQRSVWRAQRVSWALMTLFVLAGVLGLLGPGPLSRRSVASADGTLRVDYHRFVRRGAETTLSIHAMPAGEQHPVWLARSYLDGVKVLSVLPPPQRVQEGPDRLVWNVEAEAHGSGAPRTLTLVVVPEAIGGRGVEIGLAAGPALRFRQWVYP